MKLAAALAVALTMALPAASAADGQRVLGIDTTVLGTRLAWYDPTTLTRLPGRTVSLETTTARGASRRTARASRSPATVRPGPVRNARWLGNRLIAVGGIDFIRRDGLRIVDTRDWSTRAVDAESVDLTLGDGVLVGSAPFVPPDISVFGRDGTLRYRFELQSGQRFNVFWRYGYVCSGASLSRIVEPASGATVRQVQAQSLNGPACVTCCTAAAPTSNYPPISTALIV